MFDFLKKAFKGFSEKVSKPAEQKKAEEKIEEKPVELALAKPAKVKIETLKPPEEIPHEAKKPKEIQKLEQKEKEKTFMQRLAAVVTESKLTDEQFSKFFTDLELELIQNNVAFPIIQQLRNNLDKELVGKSMPRAQITEKIKDILRGTILHILETPKPLDILELAREKKSKNEALVLMFVGTNGHGKTTTLAKLTNLFQKHNYRCILAASDTFRAASIEQLEHHANKLSVRMIKHKYGADPAAVAFDAVKAKDKDIVLIDTAGRQTPDANLMEEMAKIKRVSKPDITIFVGESIAGSDLVEQARAFNEKIGIDGIILTKADVDDKGGALLSVVQATNKPIMFIGTGQNYDDIEKFEPEKFISRIL
jgi:fused signal recognition particle receptor